MIHNGQEVEANLGWHKSADTGMDEQKAVSHNGIVLIRGSRWTNLEDILLSEEATHKMTNT